MDEKASTNSLGARTSSEWVVRPIVLAAASVALTSSTLPAFAVLNRIAMRVASGAISLRISSLLPATSGIMLLKPVMFPPGRARLATRPTPTGSPTATMTMGIELVSCSTARVTCVPGVTMTSTFLTDEVACNFPNEIVAFGGKRSAVDCYILADIVPSFAKPVLACLPSGRLIRAVKRGQNGNTRYLSRPLGSGRLRHGAYTERHSEKNRGESCFNHDRLLLVRHLLCRNRLLRHGDRMTFHGLSPN